MLTPSLRGGSIPVFSFPPGCLDRGRNTGILSFDFAEGRLAFRSPYVSKRCEKCRLVPLYILFHLSMSGGGY